MHHVFKTRFIFLHYVRNDCSSLSLIFKSVYFNLFISMCNSQKFFENHEEVWHEEIILEESVSYLAAVIHTTLNTRSPGDERSSNLFRDTLMSF